MAFNEVAKTPTTREIGNLKRRLRKLEKEYDALRYQFKDHVDKEDFEVLTVDDFLRLKELYMLTKALTWQIYELENPEDQATPKAYRFLNSMSHNDQLDFLMKHGLTTHRLIDKLKENPNFIEEVTA
jgi:hypothetical protein